ncbi:MAG: hypothetical protein LBM63_05145 [Rikenellaceae bacterium]|jgi:hypothetical protein|nr:hypothetical protein [Rikenellaceae bacterium]
MKDNDFSDELDPIALMLTPQVLPPVPEGIKKDVLTQIERREKRYRSFKNFVTMKNRFSRIVASAAAVVVAVVVVAVSVMPTRANASEVGSILDRSIAASDDVRTMTMKLYVRTTPQENFAYTSPREEMVEHTLVVARGDNPADVKWRLDKGGRHVVFNGETKYLWGDGATYGFKGDADTHFEEWFNILLDPELVLMREKSALEEGVKYTIEDNADETILTAKVKAQGDYSQSDYMMFSSISESPTSRELVFDRATGLLKYLTIYVEAFGTKRLVVDVKSIEYDQPVDETALISIPTGLDWLDVTAPTPAGQFSNISALQAATLIADAIDSDNISSVREVFARYDFEAVGDRFSGAKVLKRGKLFRSGQYVGVFVPLKVKYADGRTEKVTLALRNDNPNHTWLVDGGI